MAPVAKSTYKMALARNQQGQISIFFSASLVVLISIVAFVINVGLFVKAKINLQNATDAAAYAGASVQARQLTKLAYLNWEMRNIYKEWMYKYYVVGNLNIKDVEDPEGGGKMSFRLEPDEKVLKGISIPDPYNLPAVCIHLAGSKTNICKRYAIPGLPEFGGYNLPGSEEASRAFIDTLIGTKVNDCVDRTRLNMLVATTWAYNVLSNDVDDSLAGQGPAIMSDRQGAWPRAVELAMRMRNLEYAMNRKAETGGVCKQQSGANVKCNRIIDEVVAENQLGNERIVKAFYSGYRNIGGSDPTDEMKSTFTLKEIAPKVPNLGGKFSASYLLVPENKVSYEKQYVDLRLMMVNFAVFYAAMIPRADSADSGACDISKVALPVPGYPLGFYKNPDVVTYYAVKGEADFVGMFNPFNSEAIKLSAYSAAKPFGGRIGPMLFIQREGRDSFQGRTDTNKLRSVPYFASLDVVGTPKKERPSETLEEGEYTTGAPLPINGDKAFWLKDPDGAVGGLFNSGDGVQFGIPNMVYDFVDGSFSATGYAESGVKIHTIQPSLGVGGDKSIGLFSKDQFKAFKGTLSGNVTPEQLDAEIARVRAATTYEAANYLIPTPYEFNLKHEMDSFGYIPGTATTLPNGTKKYTARIYAPLYRSGSDQQDILYGNSSEVTSAIFQFMRAQESGVLKYKSALNEGAKAVYNMRTSVAQSALGSIAQYEKAARGLSDIANLATNDMNVIREQNPQSCNSLAGLFMNFYYGDDELDPSLVGSDVGCPKTNLGKSLKEYFASTDRDPNFSSSHYVMQYSINEGATPTSPQGEMGIFSAYMPGPFNGVGENGTFVTPFSGSGITENMKRNFYSTKFVNLNSVRSNSTRNFNEFSTTFAIYSEGEVANEKGFDRAQNDFKNPLDEGSVEADFSSIKY